MVIEVLTVVFVGISALANLANASAKAVEVARSKPLAMPQEPPLVRFADKDAKNKFQRAYNTLNLCEPLASRLLKRMLQPYLTSTAIVSFFLALSIGSLVWFAIARNAPYHLLLVACGMLTVLGFALSWSVRRILESQYEPYELRRRLYLAGIWRRIEGVVRRKHPDSDSVIGVNSAALGGLALQEWAFVHDYLSLRRYVEQNEARVFAQEIADVQKQLPPTVPPALPIAAAVISPSVAAKNGTAKKLDQPASTR